jgi:hypothetical protein
MPNPWFKFYGGEYLSDPKIKILNDSERSCWISLLCFASQSNGGSVEFVSEEILMRDSGIPFGSDRWTETLGVLKKFEKLKMVTISNDVVTVKNWAKRQTSESYDRVKRFREKRFSNAEVTTDKEEDIDKNRKEEEREIGISPKEITKEFFTSTEKQEDVVSQLVGKGLHEIFVRREIKKFISYWVELNASGKKQRWETEKTFEVMRRLAKWFSNAEKWSDKKGKTIIGL